MAVTLFSRKRKKRKSKMRGTGEFIAYSRVQRRSVLESCRKGEGVCIPGRDLDKKSPSLEVEQAFLRYLRHAKLR
jgi:hypothetical protein